MTRKTREILLLSAVLGLNSADLGTLGAVAANLEHGLRIGNLEVGLAASAVSLAAAVATLPVGWLTDRVRRVPLLSSSIALWSAAMIATGAAPSFPALLGARLFLGAVQATSGPTLASLTGDLFPEQERSRIFGFIHGGELIGAGIGFLISGELAAVLSWRWSFWLLSLPGFALALAMWRSIREPARGGRPRHRAGGRSQRDDVVHRLVEEQGLEPDRSRILDEDPEQLSVRDAVRYLLRIRTNVAVILALSLGYFFLGGVQTFGVIFFRSHYDLGQAVATATAATLGIGALTGVLVAGGLADRMLGRGRLDARVTISAVGYIAAAILFVPAIIISRLAISLPLLIIAAAGLAAPSAPLDAAVLDVIPPRLWGRAEGIQTALRTLMMALSPILFGLTSNLLGASRKLGESGLGVGSRSGAEGLTATFVIMLAPIALAGLALLWARRHYSHDVAAMLASRRSVTDG